MRRESFDVNELHLREKKTMRGVLVGKNQNGHKFITENAVIYGGRKFVLESILGLEPKTAQALTLNQILPTFENGDGFPRTRAPERPNVFVDDWSEWRARRVCLVGVGIGGAGLTWGDVKDPHGNNNNLRNMIPLRCLPAGKNLNSEDAKKYFFKTSESLRYNGEVNNYNTWYLKEITSAQIVTAHANAVYEPKPEDNAKTEDEQELLSSMDIQTYAELRFSIEMQDIKEYFRAIHGNSIKNARFNELGLYFGTKLTKQDSQSGATLVDYVNVEAFSRVTFNNRGMETDGSFYDYIYYLIT